VKRNPQSEVLYDMGCRALESLVLRARGQDARLVLACCLIGSRGDVESHQRRAALGLDGSDLHFILGVSLLCPVAASAAPSVSPSRKTGE
jgi:hypothetical protein